MNLIELLMATNYKVTGGSEYLWKSFGEDARYIDFGFSEDFPIVSAVFNATTQEVFAVEIFNEENAQAWKFIDPRYQITYNNECKQRGVDPTTCADSIKFKNVDNIQALTIINQIFTTGENNEYWT